MTAQSQVSQSELRAKHITQTMTARPRNLVSQNGLLRVERQMRLRDQSTESCSPIDPTNSDNTPRTLVVALLCFIGSQKLLTNCFSDRPGTALWKSRCTSLADTARPIRSPRKA